MPKSFWCNIPELDEAHLSRYGLQINVTEHDRQSLIPWDNSTTPGAHSTCQMYSANYTQLLIDHGLNLKYLAAYLNHSRHNLSRVRCHHGWDYDMEHGDTSIVTQWDLVCDSSRLMSLTTVLMAIATVIGMLVAGYVADRWGRKKPFFIFFLIMLVFGVSFAFAPSFEGFLVLTIIHSFGSGPVYSILFTMG